MFLIVPVAVALTLAGLFFGLPAYLTLTGRAVNFETLGMLIAGFVVCCTVSVMHGLIATEDRLAAEWFCQKKVLVPFCIAVVILLIAAITFILI